MRTPRLGRAVSLLVQIGGAPTAAAVAGSAPTSSRSTSLSRIAGVNFISNCAFSHQNNDDLIVYPGQPGLSHLHQYVGNDSTNAMSTQSSLLAATTSCRRSGDTASYWAPALLSGTTPISPNGATIYYRRSTSKAVHPFPQGL